MTIRPRLNCMQQVKFFYSSNNFLSGSISRLQLWNIWKLLHQRLSKSRANQVDLNHKSPQTLLCSFILLHFLGGSWAGEDHQVKLHEAATRWSKIQVYFTTIGQKNSQNLTKPDQPSFSTPASPPLMTLVGGGTDRLALLIKHSSTSRRKEVGNNKKISDSEEKSVNFRILCGGRRLWWGNRLDKPSLWDCSQVVRSPHWACIKVGPKFLTTLSIIFQPLVLGSMQR